LLETSGFLLPHKEVPMSLIRNNVIIDQFILI